MVKIPLIKEGFENLVVTACARAGLEMNDNMRVMAISYFHSLDRFIIDFDLEDLEKYLFKAVSNDMTYHLGQDIHKKRLEEASKDAEAAKKRDEEAKLTLV